MKRSLSLFFVFGCAMLLLQPHFLHSCLVYSFAPFLVRTFYAYSLQQVLWISMVCGYLQDISSSTWPMGFFTCMHLIASFLAYRQKKHFFADHCVSFACYTAIYTSLLSGCFLFANIYFAPTLFLSFLLLFCHPFLDAFYAVILYALSIGIRTTYRAYRIRRRFA